MYEGVIKMAKLKEKYGLFTAICMVVGSVIGSGVFFKAELISRVTGGNGWVGIAAWIVGGISMMLCLLSFSCLAREYGGDGGIAGVAKESVGEKYSYFVGWFMATIYYPTLTSVLAWLSARYTLLYFGVEDFSGGLCMLLSCLYLVISFAQNALFPSFSGKIQVTTTILKLIPLLLMIAFGITKGISTGTLSRNFPVEAYSKENFSTLFPAITASMFAYEGWIAASSIGTELKNSRRNLPLALILGGISVTMVYLLYYIGIMGAIDSHLLINYGAEGIKMAFSSVLGSLAAELLTLFVALSCFGALNGMMIGSGRAMYVVATGGRGPAQKLFSQLMPPHSMPVASFVIGLLFGVIWLFFLFGSQISEEPLFSSFSFDSSEMPVVTIYALYIPMFFMFIRRWRERKLSEILVVSLGICACLFIISCAIIAHGVDVINYLFVFTSIMLMGLAFAKKGV